MAEEQEGGDPLGRMTAAVERAEAAAKAAEDFKQKADSEAAFAFNAKQACEGHATAIAQIKGTVEADVAWLTSTKKSIEDAAQAIGAMKAASDLDASTTAKNRLISDENGAGIAAAKKSADDIVVKIAAAQEDAASASEQCKTDAAAAAVARTASKETIASMQEMEKKAAAALAKATDDGGEIAKADGEARAALASIAGVVETSTAANSRVAQHELELAGLKSQFAELQAKIEGVLPGATSASLASAFRDQQTRFKKPQKNWLYTFVASIVLLLAAAFVGLPGVWPGAGSLDSWDSILRHIAGRLPIVLPLVWLGIYAGRNYTLALRLEEEYAFKEAVSRAFEGYKREMASLGSFGESFMPPLLRLCEDSLKALAERPGRIYEGDHDDVTPISSALKSLSEAIEKMRGPSKKDD